MTNNLSTFKIMNLLNITLSETDLYCSLNNSENEMRVNDMSSDDFYLNDEQIKEIFDIVLQNRLKLISKLDSFRKKQPVDPLAGTPDGLVEGVEFTK